MEYIDQFDQCLFNCRLFIGNQAGFHFPGAFQGGSKPVAQRRNTLIFVDAAGGAVGDRDQSDAQLIR